MVKLWNESRLKVWIVRHPLEAVGVFVAVVALAVLVAYVFTRPNLKALASPKPETVAEVAPAAVPAAKQPVVQQPVVKQPAVASVVTPKEVVTQKAHSVEIVTTIRQVGGGSDIIKDWHNQTAVSVRLPVLADLKWDGAHQSDGKTLYWVATSSDKGIYTFSGVDYKFDEGFVAVVMTETPESIAVTTGWNASDEDASKRHFNVWSEAFVVSTTLDKDQVSERLLAEWLVDQGKSMGFYIKSDGTVVKMKFDDAVKFNSTHPALFPEQLPQLVEGSPKQIIMTVTQVGSGSIMKDWNNVAAESVKLPVADATNWEGILKDENGNPVYLLLISSDAGKATFEGKEKEFKTGFVAAFITSEPESVSIATGWNGKSNFNVWAQKFIVPADEDIDEVLKEMLTSYRKAQGKPVGYAILSDGTVFEVR